MKQVLAPVISKGKRIRGLYHPHGRSIKFSQPIRLKCPEIAREAQPGQFVMVNCGPDCVLPRPFSIHQVNGQGDVSLYFAVLEGGKGTDWLAKRHKGDTVNLFGPLGNSFSVHSTSHNLLLVAGGMGIASLYFLAEETLKKGYSVTLLYGTAVRNWYVESLLTSGGNLHIATEDGTVGHHGLVTDIIPKHADWADQIFACGPLPMYKTMAQMPELKNKSIQVSLETRMGCGRGVCYGCTLKTKDGLKQVCQDGPVFNLDDILWDELVPISSADYNSP